MGHALINLTSLLDRKIHRGWHKLVGEATDVNETVTVELGGEVELIVQWCHSPVQKAEVVPPTTPKPAKPSPSGISAGISGTARVLLEHKEYVNKEYTRGRRANTKAADASDSSVIELPAATPAEHDFLLRNHDLLFPPRHPLDRDAFLSLAKLVFVRRIVKALVSRRGLRAVQRGMRAPLVVDAHEPAVRASQTRSAWLRVDTLSRCHVRVRVPQPVLMARLT